VLRVKRGMNHLVKLSELTEEQNKYWIEMIDAVTLYANKDKDLLNRLQFLDKEASYRKISIYDMILRLYDKDESIKRIQSWKKAKEL